MPADLTSVLQGRIAVTDWRHLAACATADPELFFPIGDGQTARDEAAEARAVCRRCPVMDACLGWALAQGPGLEGIWGGMDQNQRRTRRRSISERRLRQEANAEVADPPVTAPPVRRGPPECGTRGGYRRHHNRGEEVCQRCTNANTDADRRLRNTGTTKPLATTDQNGGRA